MNAECAGEFEFRNVSECGRKRKHKGDSRNAVRWKQVRTSGNTEAQKEANRYRQKQEENDNDRQK